MKPCPALKAPGVTEADRLDNAVRKMFRMSNEDPLKRKAKRAPARPGRNAQRTHESGEGLGMTETQHASAVHSREFFA